MFAAKGVTPYPFGVASFGENFKELRDRAGLKQEDVRVALKLKTSTPVSLMENMRGSKVPRVATIVKAARALRAEPWELLKGVETEIDQLRKRSDLLRHGDPAHLADAESPHETGHVHAGTEPATSAATPKQRKGLQADAEARLREENAALRSVLDTIAEALVGFGAREVPARDAVATGKPRRRRRAGKGA